jgi:hypothetical protein
VGSTPILQKRAATEPAGTLWLYPAKLAVATLMICAALDYVILAGRQATGDSFGVCR